MRLAIISMMGPMDLHVVRHLLDRWPEAVLIRPVHDAEATPPARRRWSRLVTSPLALGREVARSWLRARIDRRVDREVRTRLYGAPDRGRTLPAHVTMTIASLRDGTGAEQLRRWAPDVLLLCGAPILPARILAVPTRATVNVHHGIAPDYRGESCLFWTLAREDWDHVGITLHRVDLGLDRGPVWAHGYVALTPEDALGSIAAKYADLSARLALDVVDALARGRPEPQPQAAGGHTYRYGDWRARTWARGWWRRTVLRRRPPRRAERIVRHFEVPSPDAGPPRA